MGQERSGKGVRRSFVLDTGALIALERDCREVRAVLRRSLTPRTDVVIPATVLAQTWRGGPRSASLASFVKKSKIDSLDESRAREVGIRIGVHGTADVTDAHVVCCAIERQAVVVTSDPDDMRRLLGPGDPVGLAPI